MELDGPSFNVCQFGPVSGYLCDKHSHQRDPSTLEPEPAEAVDTLSAHPRPSASQMADHRAPLFFALLKRCG